VERRATIAAIEDGVRAMGQVLPPGSGERLATLLAELERWNRRINLTAIRDARSMVSQHVLDSLAARPFLEGPRVADIGTGAGFPGLPLAITEPGIEVELVDSSGKKIAFVRHIITELGVGNARAVRARLEAYAPPVRFDTVIARALGTLSYLLESAGHLVADRGVMLALKGQYPHDELGQFAQTNDLATRWGVEVSGLTVPGIEAHARHVVRCRRAASAQ
jgi:16S rRNA (guanine527-N7)-methyltransferase